MAFLKLDNGHLPIIESIRDPIIVTDLNGKIIFISKTAEKLFGYSINELLNKNKAILIPPAKIEVEEKLVADILIGEAIENIETVRLDRNNQQLKVFISLFPLKTDDNIIGITEVIRSAAPKRGSEGKFQALLESAPDAMVIVNKTGQIVLVNSQAEKVFGYERFELLGKLIEILIPDRFKKFHPAQRQNYIINPKVREMASGLELFGLRKNGNEFPAEISLAPIETEEGLLVAAAIRDVSEKQKTIKKLDQYVKNLEISNRELEQFAYVASHDLQEPLRNINNYINLLEKKFPSDSDEKEYFTIIKNLAKKMRILISDLLNYSLVGKNRSTEKVDFNKILKEVIKDMDLTILENNATISFSGLPVIETTPTEIRQLFQNFISNALKFKKSNTSPVINISCVEKIKEWVFAIQDNGIGIDEEYTPKLFQLFQRAHSVSQYPGTGLGLAICKKIVELNHGKIWVESKVGIGSTFFFTFPK